MPSQTDQRRFSEEKYVQGGWRTWTAGAAMPFTRVLANFLSFKRKGVDALAREARSEWCVLDCGCGTGAYTSWFIHRRPCTVISLDWSFQALKEIEKPRKGHLLRICADIQMLPLKSRVCDALFTIDTLGHVRDQEKALDEMLRVLKYDSPVFLHSECGNYKLRWPDRMLRRRLGYDYLASTDGHISLPLHSEVYQMVLRRFRIKKFMSPAGIFGWILGYPEKYYCAFREARCRFLQGIAGIGAVVKRVPLLGIVLRFVNACTNRLELYLGLEGGGSCFAVLRTPERPVPTDTVSP
jgi:ubiquinone/menaquinone biosynthesis C-methylase UbiE